MRTPPWNLQDFNGLLLITCCQDTTTYLQKSSGVHTSMAQGCFGSKTGTYSILARWSKCKTPPQSAGGVFEWSLRLWSIENRHLEHVGVSCLLEENSGHWALSCINSFQRLFFLSIFRWFNVMAYWCICARRFFKPVSVLFPVVKKSNRSFYYIMITFYGV